MYYRDKKNQIVVRINDLDYTFLVLKSEERDITISELIRSIIGEYRRSYEVKNNDK